jgi:sarcosine oxidase
VLERETSQKLMLVTGGVMIGEPNGTLVSGALRSAQEHRLSYERLDAGEIRRRFPAFHPDEGMMGVWEPRAGVLSPEACIAAFLTAARRNGAAVHDEEQVTAWKADGVGVQVETPRARYRAAHLLIAAGAWIGRLLPELRLPLAVERVVQLWFDPAGARDAFHSSRCPVSIWEHAPDRFFYSFPLLGPGVKVAIHHEGEAADPDHLRREVADRDAEPVRSLVHRYMPDAGGRLAASAVCMYTNTPDGHFIIDRHPEHAQVMLVSACSGHGFKFAPAIGEICSDLIVEGNTRFELGMFGAGRWGAKARIG